MSAGQLPISRHHPPDDASWTFKDPLIVNSLSEARRDSRILRRGGGPIVSKAINLLDPCANDTSETVVSFAMTHGAMVGLG